MMRKEIKRAIINVRFLGVVLVVLVFMFYGSKDDTWGNVIGDHSDISESQLQQLKQIYWNAYYVWSEGFVFIKSFFPLIISLPYVYTYVKERENKSMYLGIIRAGKRKYCFTKFAATAISGALALIIPECLYTGIVFAVFPKGKVADLGLGNLSFAGKTLSMSMDQRVIFTLVLHFVFAFAFAVFSQGVATCLKNRISVYFGVYAVYLVYDILISSIPAVAKYSIVGVYDLLYNNWDFLNAIYVIVGLGFMGVVIFYLRDKLNVMSERISVKVYASR